MPGFTKLLLHCDGADTSTTFTDESSSGHTVTASGNAQVDTGQKKFGTGSLQCDGTTDYLILDGSSDFAFGTGDFTIDFWIWMNAAITSASRLLYDSRPHGVQGAYVAIFSSAGNIALFVDGSTRITGGEIPDATWVHIALTRSGTSTRLFMNGVQQGSTYTDSNNYLNPASRPLIGASGNNLGVSGWHGFIDEIRVSKGIARWTSDFTPPTAPYVLATEIEGIAAAVSGSTAALTRVKFFAAVSAAVSGIVAGLKRNTVLAAVSNAVSGSVANFITEFLTGMAEAVSSAFATLRITFNLAGIANAVSATQGNFSFDRPVELDAIKPANIELEALIER